ncbi:MAG: type II secretion system protein GspC [Woeseiaceae bacterium]
MDGGSLLASVNRRVPPWVSLLLVIAIAWQIAKIIWLLIPGPAVGDPVSLPASAAAGRSSIAGTDVQAIASTHMFGVADQQSADAAPVISEDDNLVDTRLTNLALKGTVASAIPEFSVAVIADGNKDEKVYAINDAIGANVKLHAVYADRVVLNENGALTNLKLPREFTAAVATPTRSATTNVRQATSSDSSSIQEVLSQNLTRLSDVIRPTPYFVNGQQSGYRVYPGRNRQQFASLGLRPGDLIKDIDGQSLTDPTQAMQIFQALGTSDQVTVTVERNGQPETIILKTSQLDMGDENNE